MPESIALQAFILSYSSHCHFQHFPAGSAGQDSGISSSSISTKQQRTRLQTGTRAAPWPRTKSMQQLKYPDSCPACHVKQSKPVLVLEDSILLFLHYSSQALLGLPLRLVLAHISSQLCSPCRHKLFSTGVTSAKAI